MVVDGVMTHVYVVEPSFPGGTVYNRMFGLNDWKTDLEVKLRSKHLT